MTKSETILFFGNERLATGVTTTAPTLQALLEAGYTVPAVIVAQDSNGKSRSKRELEIANVAEQHGIPVLALPKLMPSIDDLRAFNATAAVLVAYGKIIPQAIIDVFPKGIINIHPSLLPKHRGPIPIESVILNGDTQTGVSIMSLSSKMDGGPVYAQQAIQLNGTESKQDLCDRLLQLGGQLLSDHLPDILSGALQPNEQDARHASYDKLIQKTDGVIGVLDWDGPAEVIERRIRAYAGWPKTRATIGTTEVSITKAHIEEQNGTPGTLSFDNKQLGIHTGNGTIIIDRLIPSGKKEMTGSAYLTGYRP